MNTAVRYVLLTLVLASCATTEAPLSPSVLATIEAPLVAAHFEAPMDVWEVVEITPMRWASQYRVRFDDIGVLLRHRKSGAQLFISAEQAPRDFRASDDRAWRLLRLYHDGGSYDRYIRQSTPEHSTRTFSLVEFEEGVGCSTGGDAGCEHGHGFSFIERETSHHQRGLFWKATDPDWWRYAAGWRRHDFKGRVIVLGFDGWLPAHKQQAQTLVIVEFRAPLEQAKDAERDMLKLVRTFSFQVTPAQ